MSKKRKKKQPIWIEREESELNCPLKEIKKKEMNESYFFPRYANYKSLPLQP